VISSYGFVAMVIGICLCGTKWRVRPNIKPGVSPPFSVYTQHVITAAARVLSGSGPCLRNKPNCRWCACGTCKNSY